MRWKAHFRGKNSEERNLPTKLHIIKADKARNLNKRQSVPLKLRCNILNLKVIFHLENLKSCDYYYYFIKQKYEKSSKWEKSMEEFNLEDK